MPDQPEPSTVESGPVELTSVETTDPSGEEQLPGDSGDQTPGDDGDFVSLEDLQKMSEEDLRQFITDNELKPPVEANTKQDLLDWLLSEFGVSA